MNLYYLTFAAIPSAKANGVQVMQMCQAFARRAGAVRLYCRRGDGACGDPYAFYGVGRDFSMHRVRTPRMRVLNRLWFALAVAFALRAGAVPPGVVYSRDRLTAGLVALVHRGRHPVVLEVHAPPPGAFWKWWEGRLFARRGFVRLVAISGALARDYLENFPGLARDKVLVAHDGADDADDADADAASAAASGQPTTATVAQGRAGGRLQIGYVGSLRPGKGMELISRLAPRMPECDFIVVGGDEPSLKTWKQAAAHPNLDFRGFVEPAKADAWIARFDIVLAPYQPRVLVGNDNLDISAWMSPLKLFEYMRRGKPIVASDLPVLREVLEDGVNALLAAPTEVEDWRANIRRLMEEPGLREALGARARRDFKERYTWNQRAVRVLDGLAAPVD